MVLEGYAEKFLQGLVGKYLEIDKKNLKIGVFITYPLSFI
jgi:hypothetical protein